MSRKFVDALGAARFFEVVKAELPAGYMLGVLLKFFDSSRCRGYDVVEWAAQSGHDCRVHLVWNKTHKYTRRDIDAAVERARWLSGVQSAHPGVVLWCSPFLEWDSIEGGAVAAFKRVRIAAPNLKLVNCGPGDIPGTKKEVHYAPGRHVPAGAFVSLDGHDHRSIRDSGYDADSRNAFAQGSWCFHNNGRSINGPALPMDQRKDWTTAKQFREQLKLLNT